MSATRATLYITGAVLELGGILLVAWPDVLPYAARISHRLQVVKNRLLALLGLPRGRVYVDVGTASSKSRAYGVEALSFAPNASDREKIEYLLRRDREAQERMGRQDERLRTIEECLPEQLEELRAEAKEHAEQKIEEAGSRYRPLRFVGALLLAIGLGLSTAGNLVG